MTSIATSMIAAVEEAIVLVKVTATMRMEEKGEGVADVVGVERRVTRHLHPRGGAAEGGGEEEMAQQTMAITTTINRRKFAHPKTLG